MADVTMSPRCVLAHANLISSSMADLFAGGLNNATLRDVQDRVEKALLQVHTARVQASLDRGGVAIDCCAECHGYSVAERAGGITHELTGAGTDHERIGQELVRELEVFTDERLIRSHWEGDMMGPWSRSRTLLLTLLDPKQDKPQPTTKSKSTHIRLPSATIMSPIENATVVTTTIGMLLVQEVAARPLLLRSVAYDNQMYSLVPLPQTIVGEEHARGEAESSLISRARAVERECTPRGEVARTKRYLHFMTQIELALYACTELLGLFAGLLEEGDENIKHETAIARACAPKAPKGSEEEDEEEEEEEEEEDEEDEEEEEEDEYVAEERGVGGDVFANANEDANENETEFHIARKKSAIKRAFGRAKTTELRMAARKDRVGDSFGITTGVPLIQGPDLLVDPADRYRYACYPRTPLKLKYNTSSDKIGMGLHGRRVLPQWTLDACDAHLVGTSTSLRQALLAMCALTVSTMCGLGYCFAGVKTAYTDVECTVVSSRSTAFDCTNGIGGGTRDIHGVVSGIGNSAFQSFDAWATE